MKRKNFNENELVKKISESNCNIYNSKFKIFCLKKYGTSLDSILQYFDYGEMIQLSNLTRRVFESSNKFVDKEMIKRINQKYLGNDQFGMNRKITIKIIDQIINTENFNLDEFFIFFAFYILTKSPQLIINLVKKDIVMLNIINKFRFFFSVPKFTNMKIILNEMNLCNYQFVMENCFTLKLTKNLQTLEITSDDMTDLNLIPLINLLKVKSNLKNLTINCNKIGLGKDSLNILSTLENNHNLENIHFLKCQFNLNHIELIKKVFYSYNNEIKNLKFEDNLFTLEDIKKLFENFQSGIKKDLEISFKNSPNYIFSDKSRKVSFSRINSDDYKIINPEFYFDNYINGLNFEEICLINFDQNLSDYEYIFNDNFLMNHSNLNSLSIDLKQKSEFLLQKCLNLIKNKNFVRIEIKDYEDVCDVNKEDYFMKFLETFKNKKSIKEIVLENVKDNKKNWLNDLLDLLNLNFLTHLKICNSDNFKNKEITILSNALGINSSLECLDLKGCGYNINGAEFLLNSLKCHPNIISVILNDNLNRNLIEKFEEVCMKNMNVI